MQRKTQSTHYKSNKAKPQRVLKKKTRTGKQKISSSVAINLEEKWLDNQDIFQRLHISASTLFKWRKKGLLPYSCVVGKIYYKESDVQKLLHSFYEADKA